MSHALGTQGLDKDICELATQFAVSTAEVHDILRLEICQLEQSARIQDFIALLAIKHVKDHLSRRPATG